MGKKRTQEVNSRHHQMQKTKKNGYTTLGESPGSVDKDALLDSSRSDIALRVEGNITFRDIDPDDLISPLSAEAYFVHRLCPELDKMKKQAPWLARQLKCLEILLLMA